MLIPLSTAPHWWDSTEEYGCLREVIVERNKAVDLDRDVLQAAINVSGRDKFLCDGASRRVAMKRLYRRHPVDTLCQEGLGGRSGVVGATFILIIIPYRICSKQSRVHAARIKAYNRAAVVRAVKADHTTIDNATKHSSMQCPIYHKADCRLISTTTYCEDSCSTKAMITANPAVCRDQGTRVLTCYVLEVKSRTSLLVVIRQLLLLSGDVELNPGPLDGEYWAGFHFSLARQPLLHQRERKGLVKGVALPCSHVEYRTWPIRL